MSKLATLTLIAFSALLLTSCGGGGSSSDTSGSDTGGSDTGGSDTGGSDTGETGSTPTWTQGVFEDESVFKNKCETPRTGTDLFGDSYADTAGSTLTEMHWLRSWSNNTYLWYDEIVDQDIANFDDPVTYFSVLKSFATTDSGTYRDQFHYAQDTADYQQLASGGSDASYGARIKWISTYPPRLGRIAYVEPYSPAANAGLVRGTEIVSIDGVDVEYGDSVALNNGAYPAENGETHTFEVRDVGETTTRTVSLTSQAVTNYPVHNPYLFSTDSGNVAYFTLNTFGSSTAEVALFNVFTALSEESVSDLIIDLRYNGGGYLAISSQLAYMIAGPTLTEGKTYEKVIFNDKHPLINPVTGSELVEGPFRSAGVGFTVEAGTPLPSLNLNRVFILSSGSTCSASESLINGLRGIDVEVVLIGSTTCGKPYGFYSTDNCGTTYSTIQFRGENEKSFGDYADGFSPNNTTEIAGERITGCQVEDDLLNPLGNANEAMLNAAFAYRETGSCPPVPTTSTAQRSTSNSGDLNNDPRIIERNLKEQIRLDALRLQH